MALPQITLVMLLATLQPMFRSHPLVQEQSDALVALGGLFRPMACPLFDESLFACPYAHYELDSSPAPAADTPHRHTWFDKGKVVDQPVVPLRHQVDSPTQEDRGVSPPEVSFILDSTLCEMPLEEDFHQPWLDNYRESSTPTAETGDTAGYRDSVDSSYEPWYMEDYHNYYNEDVAANDCPTQPEADDDIPCLDDAEQIVSDKLADWNAFLHGPWPDDPLRDETPAELVGISAEDAPAASETHLTYEDLFGDELDEIDETMNWGPNDLEAELIQPRADDDDVVQGNRGVLVSWLSAIRPHAWTIQAEQWFEERGAPQALHRATQWIAAQINAIDIPEEVRAPQVDARAEKPGKKLRPSSRPRRIAETLDDSELRWLLGVSSAVHRAAGSLDQVASALRGFAIKELASRADEPLRRIE